MQTAYSLPSALRPGNRRKKLSPPSAQFVVVGRTPFCGLVFSPDALFHLFSFNSVAPGPLPVVCGPGPLLNGLTPGTGSRDVNRRFFPKHPACSIPVATAASMRSGTCPVEDLRNLRFRVPSPLSPPISSFPETFLTRRDYYG